MLNYFNYFTEIEARFLERRGSILMLSTLDWALIETWRDAGIPLEVVLRGIDQAFDKHEAQRLRAGTRRIRKVNGLAWCAQAVLEAVEQSREAAVGTTSSTTAQPRESGFEPAPILAFLHANATVLLTAADSLPPPADDASRTTANRLEELASTLNPHSAALLNPHSASLVPALQKSPPLHSLEDLDRTLTVLEEKLVAALLLATPESELTALRDQAARELAPYRGKMQAVQIKQVQQQFLQKRLFESHKLPRLSLFYMSHE